MTGSTWPWAVAFLGGLAGSAHCLGMCGGFVAILAQAERPLSRLALYNGGRVASLVLIGAISGGLGAAFVATGPAAVASRGLAVLGGAIMVAVALEVLGVPIGPSRALARLAERLVGPALRPVLHARTPLAPAAFGILNAFLPCHLVWAFAAQAATLGSPLAGGTLMLAFGLGTVPAMMLGGGAGRAATRVAPGLVRLAGLVVLAVGLVTIARGLAPSATHLDHGQHGGGQHEFHEREYGRGGEHLGDPPAPAPGVRAEDPHGDDRVARDDAHEVAVVDVPPHGAADQHEADDRGDENSEEPAARHAERGPGPGARQRAEER